MNLLGIDPGTRNTGLSCFVDGKLKWVKVIKQPKETLLSDRLKFFSDQIVELITENNIESVGLENTYSKFRSNAPLTALIIQIKAVCKKLRIPVVLHNNMTVKSYFHLAGLDRKTGKERTKNLVIKQFKLPPNMDQDAFDSVLVGKYHVTHPNGKMANRNTKSTRPTTRAGNIKLEMVEK